jgi:hypothetical protein
VPKPPPPDYRKQAQPPSTQRDLFSDFYATPAQEREALESLTRLQSPIPVAPTAQRAQAVQDVAIDLADKDTYGKWLEFHITNPVVYTSLRTLALEAASRRQVYGVKALVEIARWERRFTTEGDVYKMPNAYSSLYSRFLMEQNPELRELFNTAELRTATWPTDQASVDARARTVR